MRQRPGWRGETVWVPSGSKRRPVVNHLVRQPQLRRSQRDRHPTEPPLEDIRELGRVCVTESEVWRRGGKLEHLERGGVTELISIGERLSSKQGVGRSRWKGKTGIRDPIGKRRVRRHRTGHGAG